MCLLDRILLGYSLSTIYLNQIFNISWLLEELIVLLALRFHVVVVGGGLIRVLCRVLAFTTEHIFKCILDDNPGLRCTYDLFGLFHHISVALGSFVYSPRL